MHQHLYTFVISYFNFRRMKKVSDKIWRGNQNTYFIFNKFIFPKVVLFMG